METRKNTAWSDLALRGLKIASGVAGGLALTRQLMNVFAELSVETTLDREVPELMRRWRHPGKSKPGVRPTTRQAVEALQAFPRERVELRARDGVRLVGHWFPAERPKRVILAVHGWRTNWARDFGAMIPFLLEEGCCVLCVDQRAQGESGGEVIGFGLLERWDVLDWLEKLDGFDSVAGLPVYLAGVSMGATTVLMAAGQPLPDRVRGIVADCGFTSLPDIWEVVWKRSQPLPYALWRDTLLRLAAQRLGCDPYAETTETALARAAVPVLFVHGLDDRFVPPEMTKRAYLACAAPKRLLGIPGAGHALSFQTDPETYQNALKQFWHDFEESV